MLIKNVTEGSWADNRNATVRLDLLERPVSSYEIVGIGRTGRFQNAVIFRVRRHS